MTFRALDRGTDRLVFRLWPNGPRYAKAGARLSVSRVRERSRALRVSYPDPTTLVVPAAAGCRCAGRGLNGLAARPAPRNRAQNQGRRPIRPTRIVLPPARLGRARLGTRSADNARLRRGVDDTHGRLRRSPEAPERPARTRFRPAGSAGEWRARAIRISTLALGRFVIGKGIAHVPAAVQVTVGVETTPTATAARVFLRRAIASLERYSGLYGPTRGRPTRSLQWPT